MSRALDMIKKLGKDGLNAIPPSKKRLVRARDAATELSEMCSRMKQVPSKLRKHLVAHRGFHCTKDGSHRPIENTLPAFEQAWVAGLTYCECDVFLTSDGHLMLNHDTDTSRLSLLNPSTRPVSSMTLADIMAFPMKNGCRLPLLSEVLHVAKVLSSSSGSQAKKLMIEIKSEDSHVAAPLAKWYSQNQWAISVTGVVMSFNVEVMHEFARALAEYDLRDTFTPPLMLLTTSAEEDSEPGNILIDIRRKDAKKTLLDLVHRPGSRLDGVYIEWFPGVNTIYADKLKEIVAQHDAVGVWQMAGHPDNLMDLERLLDCGVRFVNTDLPNEFLDEVQDEVFKSTPSSTSMQTDIAAKTLLQHIFQGRSTTVPPPQSSKRWQKYIGFDAILAACAQLSSK
eukprot:TRINITY_DN83232_c0_g1_i1.p1 TRINITY_DN83232_c0_g1~~TRINITY_DN83232_c0_g1_i1.p1  ORF type:complete len:396 (-),score=63.46 TRINITY_DN83232_c0_g1_i1:602-1789(-)